MALFLYITKTDYLGGLSVKLTFNDGVERTLDFSSFFKKNSHPQYNKYAAPALFKKFKIEGGNIVLGKNWDLMFPVEQLHTGVLL